MTIDCVSIQEAAEFVSKKVVVAVGKGKNRKLHNGEVVDFLPNEKKWTVHHDGGGSSKLNYVALCRAMKKYELLH